MQWNPEKWPAILGNINDKTFTDAALWAFRYQAANNPIYGQFIKTLGIDAAGVEQLTDIPFLPIELFKTHQVKTGIFDTNLIFESSGTTGTQTSRHFVARPQVYEYSFVEGFRKAFGQPEEYTILALLPSYLERNNSSLVYMVNRLINLSKSTDSGFYLDNLAELAQKLQKLSLTDTPVLLIGVSFALLDLAEQFPMPLDQIQVMETGGMKGRRKEMIRAELHEVLKTAFDVPHIYSEYGMTELLSQAYTDGSEWFAPPPWMKVLLRDPYDPLQLTESGTGAINVIDLANIDSCCFIATDDLGEFQPDGNKFQVKGRMDSSDIRGCNLLVE